MPFDFMTNQRYILQREHFAILFETLTQSDYRLIAPTIQNQAITYDEITTVDELPIGWTEIREAKTYRLQKRSDKALFGYTVGPQSWKKFLHPPTLRLWQAKQTDHTFEIQPEAPTLSKMAFIGVRACELSAIVIQDKVFLEGTYIDTTYQQRRANAFILAVNCTSPSGTCFCSSMGTGPKVPHYFDLALTEIIHETEHYFVVEVGSPLGQSILDQIPHREATPEIITHEEHLISNAAAHMGRQLDTSDLPDLLYRNYENPEWDSVASRCLSCANCTMVCPTCFCVTIEDSTSLDGNTAERTRRWDSCFTMDFSYIHGGSVRYSTRARYRQWLTHKLATWQDQFGTFGCVGCGRCITWCPVGIDLTQEIEAIRQKDGTKSNIGKAK